MSYYHEVDHQKIKKVFAQILYEYELVPMSSLEETIEEFFGKPTLKYLKQSKFRLVNFFPKNKYKIVNDEYFGQCVQYLNTELHNTTTKSNQNNLSQSLYQDLSNGKQINQKKNRNKKKNKNKNKNSYQNNRFSDNEIRKKEYYSSEDDEDDEEYQEYNKDNDEQKKSVKQKNFQTEKQVVQYFEHYLLHKGPMFFDLVDELFFEMYSKEKTIKKIFSEYELMANFFFEYPKSFYFTKKKISLQKKKRKELEEIYSPNITTKFQKKNNFKGKGRRKGRGRGRGRERNIDRDYYEDEERGRGRGRGKSKGRNRRKEKISKKKNFKNKYKSKTKQQNFNKNEKQFGKSQEKNPELLKKQLEELQQTKEMMTNELLESYNKIKQQDLIISYLEKSLKKENDSQENKSLQNNTEHSSQLLLLEKLDEVKDLIKNINLEK
ncbi:fip1-like 1 protein [Anaeramoeba flamelloides]|uniref:Fip1-like 1 protein n=1 Tax=Anaeramoeba flamelloides TaxID=1746091 RepID=A0AAV8A5P5_9EUKA|nr:fip1-like 1 protein [Anaeramoeba flamelloides]